MNMQNSLEIISLLHISGKKTPKTIMSNIQAQPAEMI